MNDRFAPPGTELRRLLAEVATAPGDAPWSMPGAFYWDEAQFAHECASVLQSGWHCVGRADELKATGDFLTLTLLDEPIIVVRSEDGIKALSNVCRHRGMPLVEGSGNAARFICPYHAWTYGLSGGLLRAPRMQNAGFDAKDCKLPEFPCVERFGFIYVSLADAPPDLDIELAGLDELIGPYEPENFGIVHSASEVWNCNWKALVENFMEGYHLSVVHPQTLHGYTPRFHQLFRQLPTRYRGAWGRGEGAGCRGASSFDFVCGLSLSGGQHCRVAFGVAEFAARFTDVR